MEKVGCSLIQLMIGISLICGIEAIRRRLGPMHAAETVRSTHAPDTTGVTQADVDLYLEVMRATAERARNPTPEDLATVAAFKRIRSAPSPPTTELTTEEKQVVQRAFLLTTVLDDVVAREKHVDSDRYRRAKAVVESVLPVPDEHRREVLGIVTPEEWQALKSKGAHLAPWAREVRELQSVIRSNTLSQSLAENEPRIRN
jgi:hypothetical protein